MKPDIEKTIEWIREWKAGITLALSAVVFSILFYKDITRVSAIGDREIIGNLTYKFNVIQRKFNKETTWGGIDANGIVTNYDTIRSDKNSVAVIKLKDGTEIEMDEESMIVLELSKKNKKISFEKGSINVKKTPVEDDQTGAIYVESPKGKVKIFDGDVILAKETQEKLQVAVARGEAEVTVSGKTLQLKKDQVLATSKEGDIQAVSSKVKMESPVERTNRMEKKLLEEERLRILGPASLQTLHSSQVNPASGPATTAPPPTLPSSSSSALPVSPSNPGLNQGKTSSSPSGTSVSTPKPAQAESSKDNRQSNDNIHPHIPRTWKWSKPNQNQKQEEAPPLKETEEERRKKEQEALERFLKM